MNKRTFELLCAIHDEDMDNSQYNFVEDVEDASRFFGTIEERALLGKWCAVYQKKDEYFKLPKPDRVLQFEDCADEELWLYLIDD